MSRYYELSKIMSQHYDINMICGNRSAGKSTAVQKYVLKRAKRSKGKEQFALLVRYDIDMTSPMVKTYWENTQMMWYPHCKIEYKNKEYIMTDENGDSFTIGYVMALNKATTYKSGSYPLINTMIFEEFLNIENKFIKNKANPNIEVDLLLSIYSSIARGMGKQFRPIKLFCISNNYYLDNPYFRYFGLIDRILEAPFQTFHHVKEIKDERPSCILEITRKKVEGGIYNDKMAKGSAWAEVQNELHYVPHPKIKEKNILFQLTFDNKYYISVCNYDNYLLIYKDKFRTENNSSIYCYSCIEAKKSSHLSYISFKQTAFYKTLLNLFNNNWMYYDSLNTFIALNNILHFTPN